MTVTITVGGVALSASDITSKFSTSTVNGVTTYTAKTGAFTGAYAVNPATGELIPVWTADYVLMESTYGGREHDSQEEAEGDREPLAPFVADPLRARAASHQAAGQVEGREGEQGATSEKGARAHEGLQSC